MPKQVHSGNEVLRQDNSPELPPTIPPPAKKRRAGRRVVDVPTKSNRGNPWELCQLNLDVLFMIATYTQPRDLLSLARTCKSLRRLFMDKSSAFIWKAYRRELKGLPDCPDDLSEPAYTNLVFSPHCHGCGKYPSATFWRMRRRYCGNCRNERLFCNIYWPRAVYEIIKITAVRVSGDEENLLWHDKDQVNSLVQEYEHSSDKEQFISDKKKQYDAMLEHAKKCEEWQRQKTSKRKKEVNTCKQERHECILERLKQLGYESEIDYFGPKFFQESRKKSKPLTDEEWARMLPKWLKTMNYHRELRLDLAVYSPRRRLLAAQYDDYVKLRDTPIFDLLPHVIELARFPPFRDIINAPEGTQMGENPFASAFAQLPTLVGEWKKQLDAQLADLVTIPPHLLSQDALAASSSVTSADKLRLACALFEVNCPHIFTRPEAQPRHSLWPDRDVSTPTESVLDRFGIEFLEEAPYIVHACGLDPGMAMPDDMDRRNARLRCLACAERTTLIMNWKDAMAHARVYHQCSKLTPLAASPRWQLVNTNTVQDVEESVKKAPSPYRWRCLLCQPRVGDALSHDKAVRDHLRDWSAITSLVAYVEGGVLITTNTRLVDMGWRCMV